MNKYIRNILLFMVVLNYSNVFGQEFKAILIEVDYSPCFSASSHYVLVLNKNKSGDLGSRYYTVNDKRKRLKKAIEIPQSSIERFTRWRNEDKRDFLLEELNTTGENIESTFQVKPLFPINYNAPILTDSFNLCNSYDHQKQGVIAGPRYFNITVFGQTDSSRVQLVKFHETDFWQKDFDLKNYLILQPLLKMAIPKAIMNESAFSNHMMNKALCNYYLNIECEDYYYQEYLESNPTIKESEKLRRMRVGWDFKEYLSHRTKAEK